MKFTSPNFYITHHQATHGGLPPDYLDKELFMCDSCPNIFISKQSLTVHIINVHKDLDKDKRPKEKKCPYCEKMFRRHQNYQEHIIVKHEKGATHKCDQCHRSYGTPLKLRNHKKLVHERVKCDECGQDICNSFTLKRHKASVHGIKPTDAYQCELCPLFYDKKASLHNHVAKHHPPST